MARLLACCRKRVIRVVDDQERLLIQEYCLGLGERSRRAYARLDEHCQLQLNTSVSYERLAVCCFEKQCADVIVHFKLVLTRESGATILRQMETGEPTDALRDLMRDGD
jgi:hypothetical protein